MCGIAGIVHPDPNQPVDPALLEAMCDRLRHRGPDDAGTWIGPGVGLGHRRLSIIDLSAAGRQPMCNEDGTLWLTFNGEIYNFIELREQLRARGHRFSSETDSEVILHLYEEHGADCVDQLKGMFAFALWDAPNRRLMLARDRVGKKPLKYAESAGALWFASELKALLASGSVSRDIAPADLGAFLALGYVPAPGTGFAGVRKLPAGHRLLWQDGRVRLERYWSPDFSSKQSLGVDEWKQRVRSTVEQCVRRRLISDVPLGAFLSGGIDSGIVVACMAQASSTPVRTFSMGFEVDAYNELPQARLVAERYGTEHHEFVVRADAAELMTRLAEIYEEPYADPSALPSYLLARETRREVTVVLNGDGGDEGFAGYTRYRRLADWNRRLAAAGGAGRALLHGLAVLAHGGFGRGLPLAELLKHITDRDLGVRYAWIVRLLSPRERRRLIGNGFADDGAQAVEQLFARPRAGSDDLDRMLFADTLGYLPDDLLVKMDLATMAHGLEARSPLLDHELLELAASIPSTIKVRDGQLKWLLREAFRDQLPAALFSRPKQGFALPVDEWFRGELAQPSRELLLGADSWLAGYFERPALARIIEEHRSRRRDRGRQLWALSMLELWHRQVVAGSPPQPAAQAPSINLNSIESIS